MHVTKQQHLQELRQVRNVPAAEMSDNETSQIVVQQTGNRQKKLALGIAAVLAMPLHTIVDKNKPERSNILSGMHPDNRSNV